MKTVVFSAIFSIFAAMLCASSATAQSQAQTQTEPGSIEFVARATPSGGLDEPVRGFPFYLLDRSYEEISREANDAYPKPDMDAFIDKLEVSKELKAWMKKNQWVTLSGEDFIHKLNTASVMDIPEFHAAYLARNADTQSVDFPKPKYKPTDKVKNPEKYAKLDAEYQDAVRHYIDANPESIDGMDLDLQDVDPSPKWNKLVAKRLPDIHQMVLELSQSKYLVARTQTDLQGQGFLHGLPPGNYWLSSLDVTADVGDARPRWDSPVMVRPGDTTYLTLSNVNAVQPQPSSASNP